MSQQSGRVVICGGSGFLGRSLAREMQRRGHEVTLISRSAPTGVTAEWRSWDGRTPGPWSAALEGAAAVINLAGRSVNCRKTPDACDEIMRSRVDSVRVLGEVMRGLKLPPPVWIQMSTAHIHGDPPEVEIDESSSFGVGLAPQVGRAWEESFAAALLPDQRGVVLRTTFVIGRDGGALPLMASLCRWGLGGAAAGGRQWISWIHEDDLNRFICAAIAEEKWRGVYLLGSPFPERNAEFMAKLRSQLGRPWSPPVPEALIRFGARWIFHNDPELLMYGRRCRPTRLLEGGFEFQFPRLEEALCDLLP